MSHLQMQILPLSQAKGLLAVIACFSITVPHVFAQTTWDGSAGGSWGVATNWTPDLVPTLNDDVTIDAGQAIVGTGLVADARALIVGDTATSSLQVQNGGSLTVRDVVAGNSAGSNGAITVDAANLTIKTSPAAIGAAGAGALTIQSGGTVTAELGRMVVGELAGSNGTVVIDGSSSELETQNGITVGDPNGGSTASVTVRNSGQLSLTGFLSDVLVNAGGVMNIESGGSVTTDLFSIESGATVNNHSAINSVVSPTVDMLTNFGTLSGSGQQQLDLNNFGVLAPDAVAPLDESGVYAIDGTWDQQSEASLEIHLGGLFDGGGNKAFTNFDWVDVTGDVTLAGGLDVALTAGFNLSIGNQFEIINVGGTLSGTFDNQPQDSTVAILGGLPLRVNYQGGDGNDVVLYVPTSFEADFDTDLDVDNADLTQWEGDYALNGSSDADGDGLSSGLDFLVWQQQFGIDATPLMAVAGAVPEPTVVSLLAALALIILSHRDDKIICD